MRVGLARKDERGHNIGAPVHGGTEHSENTLANDVIRIGTEHRQRERNDLGFPWSTAPLLASITSERVHRPCPNLVIRVVKVDEIGNA